MFNLNIKTKHFSCKGPLANKIKSVSLRENEVNTNFKKQLKIFVPSMLRWKLEYFLFSLEIWQNKEIKYRYLP